MVDRSMVVFDVGKMTGSSINVNINGSGKAISMTESSVNGALGELTQEIIRDFAQVLFSLVVRLLRPLELFP